MQQYDLCVYGHLTVDRIFTDFKETTSLGAIANFWNALNKIQSNLKVKLNPSALGEAIIVINKTNAQRTGRGNLNIKTIEPPVVDSKWHHIMYLNRLQNKEFINKISSGIISADLTAGDIDILPMLHTLDFLFVSDEELMMPIDELAKLVKGWVILHYPSGSYATNGQEVIKSTTPLHDNLNVLGAGDTFAACFIHSMLQNNNNIKLSIEYAHSATVKVLTHED